ncbi:MAG TPA: hypothetical protein PL129_09605, partial [bacterium]|nr:hypothetical protein [bacterium]
IISNQITSFTPNGGRQDVHPGETPVAGYTMAALIFEKHNLLFCVTALKSYVRYFLQVFNTKAGKNRYYF